MIDYKTLRKLVIEVFTENPSKAVAEVMPDIEKLAANRDIFPKMEDCRKNTFDYSYYSRKRFTPIDKQNINNIIWLLIREKLMVIGQDRLN